MAEGLLKFDFKISPGVFMEFYKLVFFVPETHAEEVKTAVFAAGAGQDGNYENCCWQTLGKGQFRPLPGSHPFIGNTGKLETVMEFRIEMFCPREKIPGILDALLKAHPYEEPAYEIYSVKRRENF